MIDEIWITAFFASAFIWLIASVMVDKLGHQHYRAPSKQKSEILRRQGRVRKIAKVSGGILAISLVVGVVRFWFTY